MENSLAIRDNILDNITKQIPSEIVSLLWFKNGPLANLINEQIEDSAAVINGIKVTFQSRGQEEPSLIDFLLPVTSSEIDEEESNSLSYYPSYASMSPGQRKTYLNWLCNIDSPINISYVFVFYYGLERHLYLGDYQNAIRIITRLIKNHTNKSFCGYATNALIGSCIFRKDYHALDNLLEDDLFYSQINKNSPAFLLYKYYKNDSITIDEVISLAKFVGFTNTRYLKDEYNLFFEELEKQVCKKYPGKLIPISDFSLANCPSVSVALAANTSLEKIRYREIPDIRGNTMFKSLLNALLAEAHESVKAIKKLQRKKGV